MSEVPTCPDCGSKCVRVGPYFNILGELSHLSVIEASDEYYQNPEQYRDDSVRVFECGTKRVVKNSAQPEV